MGMAASQARYLALLARKSNCEYEGQQINQSRLALSNQSADLFNQMMGLQVPTTPSKSDYTIQTYVFTDGLNQYTMDKWNRLAEADSDGYNYAVTYHYDTLEYTGYQKYKLDPQVQFSGMAPTSSVNPDEQVRTIQLALIDRQQKESDMNKASDAYQVNKQKAGKISTYQDISTITKATCVHNNNEYTITCEGVADPYVYKNFNDCGAYQNTIKEYLSKLMNYGAIEGDPDTFDFSTIYYNEATDSVAFATDLEAMIGEYRKTNLPIYHVLSSPPGASYVSMKEMDVAVQEAYKKFIQAKSEYDAVADIYAKYDIPTKIGNIKLTPLASLDDNQLTAITQIIANMKDEEIETNLTKCFDTLQGEYTAETYKDKGGIYTFEMVGTTYYTTYYDLYNSIVNGTGINHIDDQAKLPYYAAQDMETPVTITTRALIEKDKSGRFISMRLEDDSLVYDLKSVSETDELAYDDAMSEYNYQRALYDKQVSDINAKTSIIQKQDQNLELRLKQLDTEQSALNTEIEAVSKVVKDNIEKSFKTFSG